MRYRFWVPGGIFQVPQVFFLRATLPLSLLKHFWLFHSTMNFNFVEAHIFTTLVRYIIGHLLQFVSLVDFLGPEISVWKFWPNIPSTLCTKLWGPVAPLNFFNFFHILQVWFYYQNEMRGCSEKKKIPFLFSSESPCTVDPYKRRVLFESMDWLLKTHKVNWHISANQISTKHSPTAVVWYEEWAVRTAIFTEIRQLVEELITCLSIFGPQKLGILTARLNVTHHIKTGQLWVECISRYYTICMGKNKGNKKKLRLIFDHKIAMLHPIYTWVVSSLS